MSESINSKTRGARLAELIKSLQGGGTLAALSRKTGIDHGTLSGWLTGDINSPRQVSGLLTYLGLSEDDFWTILDGDREIQDVTRPCAHGSPTAKSLLIWLEDQPTEFLAELIQGIGGILLERDSGRE